jgi:hypothetical protein
VKSPLGEDLKSPLDGDASEKPSGQFLGSIVMSH